MVGHPGGAAGQEVTNDIGQDRARRLLVHGCGGFSFDSRRSQAGALLHHRRRLLSCNYKALDGEGSFRVSAPGYPTITLEIDQPGFAFGYARFGSRNRSLPGQFVRSRDDGACWNNPQTNTKVCAW